jgi:peptidyl-prolyl cis-trans isomerase SurA
MGYRIFTGLLTFISSLFLPLQADQTLMTLGGQPVSTDEFTYIYQKNNINNSADFSKASLESYLELFVNYKLKVREAVDMGMDTLPELAAEYKSYEQQLFDAYLSKQLMDPLVKKAYERSKFDIGISHIFISSNTEGAEQRIQSVHSRLKAGESFEKLAAEYSQDENSAALGGKIGYFTALQIGYPQLEDAAYNTEVGDFSIPVQTPIGFHIVKVFDKRQARGRIKVAVIKRVIPDQPAQASAVEKLVDSLYQMAISGVDFGDLATRFSEDQKTNLGAGEMDWFGINTYAATFEDAAFALKKDGEISKPFKTETSWYIIKRLMATRELTFEEAEPVIKAKLQKSRQYAVAMESFHQQLKQSYRFKEYEDQADDFKLAIEDYVNRYPFKFQEVDHPKPILSVNGKDFNTNEMGAVLNRVASKVVGKVGADRVAGLYEEAVKQVLIDKLREDLPTQSREYGALLEEYKNGVLIFDLTRSKVWNRAVSDSIGLAEFFAQNRDKYKWNKRALGLKFISDDASAIQKIKGLSKANSKASIEDWKKILQEQGLEGVKVESLVFEQGVAELSPAFKWEKGAQEAKEEEGRHVILLVQEIRNPEAKELNECRGFVIASYQEALDKAWVKSLREKYPVEINQQVFESLIKK